MACNCDPKRQNDLCKACSSFCSVGMGVLQGQVWAGAKVIASVQWKEAFKLISPSYKRLLDSVKPNFFLVNTICSHGVSLFLSRGVHISAKQTSHAPGPFVAEDVHT